MSMDPYSVCDTLAHGIRAASDGSVRNNTEGSFGWVLSAQDGKRTPQEWVQHADHVLPRFVPKDMHYCPCSCFCVVSKDSRPCTILE